MHDTLRFLLPAAMTLGVLTTGAPVLAGEQDAIDGCIDRLRAVGGPDGRSGEVISSEYSEAATLVMLRDAGGTTYRCLAYSDGTVAELAATDVMDDGGGAMANDYSEGGAGYSGDREIRFSPGRSSGEFDDYLEPGDSRRWALQARNGQELSVGISAQGPGVSYQIFNPDDSFLQDQWGANNEYGGQLWQTGTHVIEVINRGDRTVSYTLWVGVD